MWAQISFVLSQCTRQTDGQKGLRNIVLCITCSRTRHGNKTSTFAKKSNS